MTEAGDGMPPVGRDLRAAVARLRAMTPEEFRESLVRAGIVDAGGKLTKPYRARKSKGGSDVAEQA